MMAYEWPGNVRQLENAVQRAVVLSEGENISMADLLPQDPLAGYRTSPPERQNLSFSDMKKRVLEEFTRRYIKELLEQHRGNVTRAAKALGMRRTSLQRLLRQHGLEARTFR
jgi:DNA-binding NtrC family response regulator